MFLPQCLLDEWCYSGHRVRDIRGRYSTYHYSIHINVHAHLYLYIHLYTHDLYHYCSYLSGNFRKVSMTTTWVSCGFSALYYSLSLPITNHFDLLDSILFSSEIWLTLDQSLPHRHYHHPPTTRTRQVSGCNVIPPLRPWRGWRYVDIGILQIVGIIQDTPRLQTPLFLFI